MNKIYKEPRQQVEQVASEDIAAVFAVGLLLAGLFYLFWKVSTSSSSAEISSETAKALTESTMSAVDIAEMLNS